MKLYEVSLIPSHIQWYSIRLIVVDDDEGEHLHRSKYAFLLAPTLVSLLWLFDCSTRLHQCYGCLCSGWGDGYGALWCYCIQLLLKHYVVGWLHCTPFQGTDVSGIYYWPVGWQDIDDHSDHYSGLRSTAAMYVSLSYYVLLCPAEIRLLQVCNVLL